MPPILWQIEKLPGPNDGLAKNAGGSIDRVIDIYVRLRTKCNILGTCQEKGLLTIKNKGKIVDVVIVTHHRLTSPADSDAAIIFGRQYASRVARTHHDLHWLLDTILLDGLPDLAHARAACTQHLDDAGNTALLTWSVDPCLDAN